MDVHLMDIDGPKIDGDITVTGGFLWSVSSFSLQAYKIFYERNVPKAIERDARVTHTLDFKDPVITSDKEYIYIGTRSEGKCIMRASQYDLLTRKIRPDWEVSLARGWTNCIACGKKRIFGTDGTNLFYMNIDDMFAKRLDHKICIGKGGWSGSIDVDETQCNDGLIFHRNSDDLQIGKIVLNNTTANKVVGHTGWKGWIAVESSGASSAVVYNCYGKKIRVGHLAYDHSICK